MSKNPKADEAAQPAPEPQQEQIPMERTNAYRAGYLAGYTADNPNADPSVAGYMDGYLAYQPEPKSE